MSPRRVRVEGPLLGLERYDSPPTLTSPFDGGRQGKRRTIRLYLLKSADANTLRFRLYQAAVCDTARKTEPFEQRLTPS